MDVYVDWGQYVIKLIYESVPNSVDGAVLKCVCKNLHEVMQDERAIDNLSFPIVCYFNISPTGGTRKLDLDISILSFMQNMLNIGWKYDYKSMECASGSVDMMRALRDASCYWGVDTMTTILMESSYKDRDKQIRFCVEEGYPLLVEHVEAAITHSSLENMQLVIGTCIQTGEISRTNIGKIVHALSEHHDPAVNAYGEELNVFVVLN
jgi:hypothetical protein